MDGIKIRKGMSDKEIDEFVNYALNEMTFEEKLDQMAGGGFFKFLIADRKFAARAYPTGGVKRLGIPPFLFTDGPRGVIIIGSTCFPVSMARGASWDINLEERVGEVIGKEVRAHEGNLYGGVCINLLRHPAWGRAQETYGEDPFHIGEFGAALVRGVQKHNVMATIKHYIANSIEDSRFKVNVKMDERTLREVYLPQYKKCIEEGCATVMSAYNKFRGQFCGHNPYLLRKILKEEWGFTGFVHSDWMYGVKDTIGGITGGLDVEMPRAKYYGKKLKKAVEKGQVPMELIDKAVKRIVKTVLQYTTKEDLQLYDKSLVACEDHIQLAREVAEKSMVMLKNENKVLPLDEKKIETLAVIGPLADMKNTGDRGSSNVRQNNIMTPLQGLKNLVGKKVNILYNNGSDITAAEDLAISADAVIVVVGYTYKDEGENIPFFKLGGDRVSLHLHKQEIELIKRMSKLNQKCIVTLVGGSAIVMEEWKDDVPAILMAWYSGMEGGNALANILFGNVNPSGKLPFTIPKDPNHLPFFKRDIEEIEYGYYHGYSLIEKENLIPAFNFGFGLSYTEYEYKNLDVSLENEEIIAKADIANIGDVSGEEIVQLYIGFENSLVERPKKLLRGFKRVNLNPNETKNVEIKVSVKDLAWYNPESKSWEIEEIKYMVLMGSSSKKEDLLITEIKL